MDSASLGTIISTIFWILIALALITPSLRQRALENSRIAIIRAIELKRKSRVIVIIHRQETMSLLGIPIARYISIEDSEAVLRAIRLTPPDMPIDIILHTPGGLVLATEQIAYALVKHKSPVTVFVPHYAMSGGTLLALASDDIVMDDNAVLGPVDPQIGDYPAVSIIKVAEEKNKDRVSDETLILADISRKAIVQVKDFVRMILTANNYTEEQVSSISEALTSGQWTHDYPVNYEQAKQLGLKVSLDMPKEIYELMDLYPQNPSMRPSVQYIPLPYKKPNITPGAPSRK
ncbi:MAG: SDH family Clp fold serine proteinase [Caldisericaceae bacterium]